MGKLIERSGNLLESGVQAIGHGINVEGKMGAGIAKAFATTYPDMYSEYVFLCSKGEILPGTAWVWEDPETDDIVLNIASQDHPGKFARLDWVDSGVQDAIAKLHAIRPNTDLIALPRIGCGIGGLEWDDVKLVLTRIVNAVNIDIEVWTL